MNLIIVESPTKANTLQQFLGKKFRVVSSYGHIRDLPKGEFGVDIENDFKPKYVIPTKARKTITSLKKSVQNTESTILATDEDREGEAIAWHLMKALGLKSASRIVFHEITKQAIEEALRNPREIDMKLVNAQQARRILDRIVGYKLSPFLWKKVARGLSAGRVQSVTVRLVAEREKEIENFIPQEYWTIIVTLKKLNQLMEVGPPLIDSGVKKLEALLIKNNGNVIPKLGIKTKKEAEKIVKNLKNAEYKIMDIEKKEVKRNPLPPFITSTLQQEAWKRFRFPAKFTMGLAQGLYEKGFITYHRSDSFNLSNLALFAAKKFITQNYGKKYWAGFLRKYKTKGRAQEAHEAIRPAYPDKTPEKLKIKEKPSTRAKLGAGLVPHRNKVSGAGLDQNQLKLYELIWQRFIACQMAQASFDSTKVEVEASAKGGSASGGKNYMFRATGQILKFDGFLKIYPIKFEEKELPQLEEEEALELIKLVNSQHFTQPPPRYTEATLIKTLEENGIGRPSTYAPTLSTIQERNYIEKDDQRKFRPTEIGIVVNDLLVNHFPKIVDIKFTAGMEDNLDKIAHGKEQWVKVLKEFYGPFEENLKKKYEEVSKKEIAEEKTEKICPKCNSYLLIKLGKFGRFYACSKFPECRYTEPLEKITLGIKCPKCDNGEIVEKRTRKKKIFYACDTYPKCDFALWDKPTGEKCPQCDSLLIETQRKQTKCSNKECNFKK